jgi:hypothetical protein
MAIYVETSAVLAWLMRESASDAIEAVLAADRDAVTSILTLVECDRTLLRLVAQRKADAGDAADLQRLLAEASCGWNILPLDAAVLARVREPFPDDSVSALAALHVASALMARTEVEDLAVLTLDDRVRRNALAFGFAVLPA